MRVEGVSQTVADVVGRDDREKDHQAGEYRQPRVLREICLRIAEQVAL
jgi:hypothetical protein